MAELNNSSSPYDKIMLGLLQIQAGQTRKGVITLDDLCTQEPNLLITPAIRQYLKEITARL